MLVASTKVASAGVDLCDENIAALFDHGAALDYAPAELRADREVVVQPSRRFGRTTHPLSSKLTARSSLPPSRRWAGPRLLPAELKVDRVVVLAAIAQTAGPALRTC